MGNRAENGKSGETEHGARNAERKEGSVTLADDGGLGNETLRSLPCALCYRRFSPLSVTLTVSANSGWRHTFPLHALGSSPFHQQVLVRPQKRSDNPSSQRLSRQLGKE